MSSPQLNSVGQKFFDRDVVAVARDLLGRTLRAVDAGGESRAGVIVEAEAYGGPEDPASHAAFRPGGRAAAMAGAPGTIYVYAAYGMYPCFNIVTGPRGVASAVLVRGVWMAGDSKPTLGPGRTARALGISLDDHGFSIPGSRFSVGACRTPLDALATPRIGITRGTDREWRFVATQPKRLIE